MSPILRPAWRRRLRRMWWWLSRQSLHTESFNLFWLAAFTVAITLMAIGQPEWWPVSMHVVPMALGSILLGPRRLPWFIVFVLALLSLVVVARNPIPPAVAVSVIAVFLIGFIFLVTSFRRSRLGVAGAQGESMLVDLRDRIQSQGRLPALPPGWYAESALRSAGGSPFAGDFVVATRRGVSQQLDVAVVDVSGKGEEAGTRALLLSGAFSGLLGTLPTERFLPAANEYLLRQNWQEGFATAVHLCIDLQDGRFQIRTAGHPPAVHLQAGSGRWVVHESQGPALGLFADAEFEPACGQLNPGDALLLYTDGLVETRTRDIGLGIDKLLGQADRLLQQGFDDGARRLIDRLGSRHDDRALMLLHRR